MVVSLFITMSCMAQDVALKTNTLGWVAGGTINAGVEVGTGRNTTLQLHWAMNPWTYPGDRRARFWNVTPEARYWFCQRFVGSFVGVHLLGGEYNIQNFHVPFHTLPHLPEGYHYEGWYVGAGLTYGYQWILSRRWNLEGSLGLGYARSYYRKCKDCRPDGREKRNYVGPTKVALSLIYNL